MKKPADLKQWTRSWSEFCSWPVLYDTHSTMCLWDQPLVFAHSLEDILSYSEESISYLGTVSSLLGLSFFGQPWELPLSANQHLLLCLFCPASSATAVPPEQLWHPLVFSVPCWCLPGLGISECLACVCMWIWKQHPTVLPNLASHS